MSTPRQLELPGGVQTLRIGTSRGEFAAIAAPPAQGEAVLEQSSGGAVLSGAALPTESLEAERILLLPGWTGSKEDFGAIVLPLAQAGYLPVAVDMRGQYETPGVDADDAYSMQSYALDALALRAALGPSPVHLLGHSFGGLVAQRAVVIDPSAFASVTLLCAGPAAVPEDRHPLLRLMAQAIEDHGLDVTYNAKRAHDVSQGLDVDLPEDVEEWLRRRFLSHDPQSLKAMTLHLVEAADHSHEVAATEVPALVAFGSEDDGWPLEDQRRLARVLGHEPCVIPAAGHSPAVEVPEVTAKAIADFLAGVNARHQ